MGAPRDWGRVGGVLVAVGIMAWLALAVAGAAAQRSDAVVVRGSMYDA